MDIERRESSAVNGYTSGNELVVAIETERRRLASVLGEEVIEGLTLLAEKAAKFEKMNQHNDDAQMTAAVLGNLARNVLHSARDLQASLNPTTLETLGLEPALEALAAALMRSTNLRVTLNIERLRERLPPQVELAIFRTAQEVLDYTVCGIEETHASLRLETIDGSAVFTFWNPYPDTEEESFAAVAWRVEVLGGQIETRTFGDEGFELTIRFPLRSEATLTEREMEVMVLLGEGMTNKEIADRLSLSPRTVNFHLDNIYGKLGVNSRTEAVVYALRHNWIRRIPATHGNH